MKLIKFGAKWCSPCLEIDKYINDFKESLEVVNVDIEESPTMTAYYNVRSVPTLVLEDEFGGILATRVGGISKSQLEKWIKDNS